MIRQRAEPVTHIVPVGALVWLSKKTNHLIDESRFVFGDMVNPAENNMRTINLLAENITVEGALLLSRLAKEAVEFLEQEKVIAKTLEPNFCHAKLTVFKPKDKDDRHTYYLSGSSNLTEAGIGLKKTIKVEPNVAGSKKAVEALKLEEPAAEKYHKDKYDLITWFIVS